MDAWRKFIDRGDVSNNEYFTLKEWFGEKLTELAVDSFADYIANIAMAFPVIAVAGGCVYVFINIFSSRAAKLGAIATVIYGMLIAN